MRRGSKCTNSDDQGLDSHAFRRERMSKMISSLSQENDTMKAELQQLQVGWDGGS